MKWIWRFLVLSFTLILSFGMIPYPEMMFGLGYDISSLGDTGTKAVYYKSLRKLTSALEDYPVLLECGINVYKDQLRDGTFIIPGMESTLSIDRAGNPDLCGHMTPQGICCTDDFILISAYCHDLEHNSVIYVLDKTTHQYIKTVVLSGRPHAGSICWDSIYRHVWVSTGYTDHASASYLRIREIEKYDFSNSLEPLAFDYRESLPELERNSFMTWHQGKIMAGTFTDDKLTMSLLTFNMTFSGHLLLNKLTEAPKVAGSSIIGSECQGIAYSDDYVFLTFSNGPYKDSQLCIYRKDQTRFLKSDAIKTFNLPPCLEQPYVDGDTLYLLWESCAQPFRNILMTHVDRVIPVSISALMEYEQE